jgi:hypothetical protein
MVLHFTGFLQLAFLSLKVTFYGFIHPKKEVSQKKIVHGHKLTNFAYFAGQMHILQLLWVFLTAKKRKKKHLCMIVCE